jgi:hypothetical protein
MEDNLVEVVAEEFFNFIVEYSILSEVKMIATEWNELEERIKENYRIKARSHLRLLAEKGVVRLAKDQTFPSVAECAFELYSNKEVIDKCRITQKKMVDAGFVRVEPLLDGDV